MGWYRKVPLNIALIFNEGGYLCGIVAILQDYGAIVLLLCFSAGWCRSGRMLTPKSKKFYEELGDADRSNLEVVWVSRDREAADQIEYYEKAMPPWYYIPLGDPNIQGFLEKYGVKVIPALKLVNDKGEVLSESARADVEGCVKDEATKCYNKWKEMY